MAQHQITTPQELLDDSGRIIEEGYSTLPLQRYRRTAIRASWLRIKEWDYYAVIDQTSGFGVTMTLADLGYVGLFALCLVDIKTGWWEQVDTLALLPRGHTGLAESVDSDNVVDHTDATLTLTAERSGDGRLLRFSSDAFPSVGSVSGEISLHQPADVARMVIATSWENQRTAFYYNQKINCMPAEGVVQVGTTSHAFTPDGSFGVLDWGRGRWTYRNRWYWASASGTVAGVRFGFNLGYGFSDRSSASENMMFYNGAAHKLNEVVFDYDPQEHLQPWRITDDEGRLDLTFRPTLDRSGDTNLLLVRSVQHQPFGYYSGTAVLDDGTRVMIDELPGFIEDIYNRW